MIRTTAILFFFVSTVSAAALELAMPKGSVLTVDETTETGGYALPDGPFYDGYLSTRQISGFVSRQIWQLDGDSLETEQLITPLRDQLQSAGFAILLDCDATSCGGFDFRFSTEVLPAPDMFVDLIDYRFVSALRDSSDGQEAVGILVSKNDVAGLTQLIAVQPNSGLTDLPLAKPGDDLILSPADLSNPQLPSDVIKALNVAGHVILSDLAFNTGSADLSETNFPSLVALAEYMRSNPEKRVALVGHTDNVGSLEGNQALSEKRARAVRDTLINTYDVPATQLEAKGVGYLAPIASNETDAGRTANRRVEAVALE